MRRIDWHSTTLWLLGGVWCVLILWLVVHALINLDAYLNR